MGNSVLNQPKNCKSILFPCCSKTCEKLPNKTDIQLNEDKKIENNNNDNNNNDINIKLSKESKNKLYSQSNSGGTTNHAKNNVDVLDVSNTNSPKFIRKNLDELKKANDNADSPRYDAETKYHRALSKSSVKKHMSQSKKEGLSDGTSMLINGSYFSKFTEESQISQISMNGNSEVAHEIANNMGIFQFNLRNKKDVKYEYFGKCKKSIIKKQNDNNNEKPFMSKSGFSILSFSDSALFAGYFIENKAEGICSFIESNKTYYRGYFKSNQPRGFGLALLDQELLLSQEGYYAKTGLNGIGIESCQKLQYTYYGNFESNRKSGIGTLQWNDGVIYQGMFRNGLMNGYGMIKYPGNKFYQGQISNGKMSGYGEFFWSNGNKYFGYYSDDKRNGFGVFIWDEKENTIEKTKTNNNNNFFFSSSGYEGANENENEFVNEEESIESIKEPSGYVGFWKDGEMHGVGVKISSKDIKYGIWKDGIKQKWMEGEREIRMHLKKNQYCYLRILLLEKSDIYEYFLQFLGIERLGVGIDDGL